MSRRPSTAPGLAVSLLLALALTALVQGGAARAASYILSSGGILSADDADEVITDQATLDQISVESQGYSDPNFEAYWGRENFEVFINHERIGYVKLDDWDELDVDELWESYEEGARNQSEQLGYEVRPVRWVIPPTLDPEGAVAYYAFEVKFGEEDPLINMVIYDFGRYGYEEMTMVQLSSDFPVNNANAIATQIAGAFQFGPQSDYGDFQEGDTVAAVGAAGLIAAALGVKFGKGFLVVALLFLKKFWFLALLIPALGWKWIRGWFGGGTQEA